MNAKEPSASQQEPPLQADLDGQSVYLPHVSKANSAQAPQPCHAVEPQAAQHTPPA